MTVRIFLVPLSEAEERRSWIEMDKFVHQLKPLEKAVVPRRGAQSSVVRKPAVMRPELLKQAAFSITQDEADAMVAAGLPATVADLFTPFVGRVASVREVFLTLGPQRWQVALPFLIQHATILPSEQPRPPTEDDTAEEIEALEADNYCTCGWPYNLLLPRGTSEGMPFRLAVVCSDWEIDQVGEDESCGSASFCGARGRYPDRRQMGYPFDRLFTDSISDTIMVNANMAFRDIVIRRLPDVIADH